MSEVSARLASAGLTLPDPPAALGAYVPAVRAGSLVFTAGQLPLLAGALLTTGRVGVEVSLEAAAAAAHQAALNAVAAAQTVCDLDEVAGAVKLVCYVASDPGCTAHAQVANAASDVLRVAFGENGRHAREAIGVASLPLGAPVEVSLVLALR